MTTSPRAKRPVFLIVGTILAAVLLIAGAVLVFSADPALSRTGQALVLAGLGAAALTLAVRKVRRRNLSP